MTKKKIVIILLFLSFSIVADSSERNTTVEAFIYGQKSALNSSNEKTECNKIDSKFQIFCEEGYAEAAYLKKPELDTWLNNFESYGKFNPSFVGLGIAFARLKLDPNQVKQKLEENKKISNDQLLFAIDGYGFGTMTYGLSENNQKIRSCLNFIKKDYIDACYFGVGRGLYFVSTLNIKDLLNFKIKNEYEALIYSGFGFASSFGGKEKIGSLKNVNFKKGFKLGILLDKFLANKLKLPAANDFSCLIKQQYFLKCMSKYPVN